MIILLLGLLSVSVIYLVRLLSQKRMGVASLAIGLLYIAIVAWVYSLFIFDAASLGFNGSETWRSIIIGSDIYRSFIDLRDVMSSLPDSVLHAIAYVSIIVFATALLVVIHGAYCVAKVVINLAGKSFIIKERSYLTWFILPDIINKSAPIIRLNCRMNC